MGMKVKTQSKKVNKAWLNQHVNDPYVLLARKDGYRARAAYKLKEIDETLGLVRPGQCVVDLGSTPGAWSQYLRRRLRHGAAVGELQGPSSWRWTCCPWTRSRACSSSRAIFASRPCWPSWSRRWTGPCPGGGCGGLGHGAQLLGHSPRRRGAHHRPGGTGGGLCRSSPGPEGALVVKLFHGGAYDPMVALFRQTFRTVKTFKPKASRDKSSETFLVGMGLK
jgi:23S rRNA (uridine2552-2'-O)-methyltransferase